MAAPTAAGAPARARETAPAAIRPQCASPKVCVCSNEMCVLVCQTNSDCATPQICIEGSCSNPGCGGNSDRAGGRASPGSNCESPTAASQLHSRVIAPLNADVHQGNTVQLSVVAALLRQRAALHRRELERSAATTWAAVDQTGLVTGGAATRGRLQQAVVTATLTPGISRFRERPGLWKRHHRQHPARGGDR